MYHLRVSCHHSTGSTGSSSRIPCLIPDRSARSSRCLNPDRSARSSRNPCLIPDWSARSSRIPCLIPNGVLGVAQFLASYLIGVLEVAEFLASYLIGVLEVAGFDVVASASSCTPSMKGNWGVLLRAAMNLTSNHIPYM